ARHPVDLPRPRCSGSRSNSGAAPATVGPQNRPSRHCAPAWEGGRPDAITSRPRASPETGLGSGDRPRAVARRHVAVGDGAAVPAFPAPAMPSLSPRVSRTAGERTKEKASMYPIHRAAALAAAIALALPAISAAQEARTLDAVQVTASRVERAVSDIPASVTVLTRDDIERSQAPDLDDLLARQAGIDAARTGGPGSASTVFLRGGNATHALVLVDGVRVSSTGQGVFDFAHLPLDQIERIEIVRGPRAAIWGSDAISGVIHIFTRDPDAATARLHAGSYGRWGASTGFGQGDAERGFGLTLGYERLRGFSATPAGAFAHDPDRDGYENRNLGLRGHTTLGSQRLGFTALATDADLEFDQGDTRARNASAGLTLGGRLGERWR